jgi:hypothetical protein
MEAFVTVVRLTPQVHRMLFRKFPEIPRKTRRRISPLWKRRCFSFRKRTTAKRGADMRVRKEAKIRGCKSIRLILVKRNEVPQLPTVIRRKISVIEKFEVRDDDSFNFLFSELQSTYHRNQ